MEHYIRGDIKYGPWHRMPSIVQSGVFKLVAGNRQGTSFVIATAKNNNKGIYKTIFITAGHLLEDIANTDDPILFDLDGNKFYESRTQFSSATKLVETAYDTALLVIKTQEPIIPEQELLAIHKSDGVLQEGLEMGWLGYHGFESPKLKLFRGFISQYDPEYNRYLLDAEPKSGISGSPAFTGDGRLVGIITTHDNNYEKYVQQEQLSLIPLHELKASFEQSANTIIL